MLSVNMNTMIYGMPPAICAVQEDERTIVERFAARVNALGPFTQAPPALQRRVLEEVRAMARRFDGRAEAGSASGYDRRVLVEEHGRWSLAAIVLRTGQQIHPHDHGGWGCAVTVQGIERDRRFAPDSAGNLTLSSERDYPPGTGYLFSSTDIHQPVGADPRQVTVSLHFLVHDSHTEGPRGHREPAREAG